MFALMGFSSV